MKVRIADKDGQVYVTHEETKTSVSTGRELRRFEADVSFITPRDDDEIQQLQEKEPTVIAILDDGTEVVCTARVASSSYTEGDPHRHFSIELEEREEFNLEGLEVAEEHIDAYDYQEDVRGNVLTCMVKVRLSQQTLERFWRLRGANSDERYFDVIRHGISDKPRRMRFGQILWQGSDDDVGKVAASLVLVDKIYDDDPENRRLSLHGPEIREVRKATVRNNIMLEHILKLLEDRQIITRDEVDDIRQIPTDEEWERQMDYYRVDDLEEWT